MEISTETNGLNFRAKSHVGDRRKLKISNIELIDAKQLLLRRDYYFSEGTREL